MSLRNVKVNPQNPHAGGVSGDRILPDLQEQVNPQGNLYCGLTLGFCAIVAQFARKVAQ